MKFNPSSGGLSTRRCLVPLLRWLGGFPSDFRSLSPPLATVLEWEGSSGMPERDLPWNEHHVFFCEDEWNTVVATQPEGDGGRVAIFGALRGQRDGHQS